jgi:hypothetical protein
MSSSMTKREGGIGLGSPAEKPPSKLPMTLSVAGKAIVGLPSSGCAFAHGGHRVGPRTVHRLGCVARRRCTTSRPSRRRWSSSRGSGSPNANPPQSSPMATSGPKRSDRRWKPRYTTPLGKRGISDGFRGDIPRRSGELMLHRTAARAEALWALVTSPKRGARLGAEDHAPHAQSSRQQQRLANLVDQLRRPLRSSAAWADSWGPS